MTAAPAPTPEAAREALRRVQAPVSSRDVVSSGIVRGMEPAGGSVPPGAEETAR